MIPSVSELHVVFFFGTMQEENNGTNLSGMHEFQKHFENS